MNAPATIPTPNLPALIDALPSDSTRAPQTEFTRERQVAFLSALAASGSARRAAKAAGVSHQTAYRMRRASAEFRRAWNAALLAARAAAEDVLACRALEGVEEQVFYHGEVVATRRRYDSRLLLAHLARLDKLTEDAATCAFADDFEAALDRFARGEPQPEPHPEPHPEPRAEPAGTAPAGTPREGGGISSPGQCNRRSMSRPGTPGEGEGHAADQAGDGAPGGDGAARPPGAPPPGRSLPPGYDAWEPDMDDPDHWRGGVYIPPLSRLLNAMEAERPPGAPLPHQLARRGFDTDAVEAEQVAAFEAGVERWWLVVPPEEGEDPEAWHFAED
ncbi:hypothetical protein [Pelagerythrobacter marinus]|uniref:hypothetical protein n=1 Tax=Pelagerythrobacter marinus TaxID=538382 RepID=UPI002036AEB0|nr:hypothetical protein [Pelagerythrobacter marinus]USA40927.1 hypothetical protein NCF86_07245 [Pelagerythrobacter marinus]WPZ07899.1 hypothetical protein T8T98_05105 [Pelagerythrobacter marinus]